MNLDWLILSRHSTELLAFQSFSLKNKVLKILG